jgi:hypothetical protein
MLVSPVAQTRDDAVNVNTAVRNHFLILPPRAKSGPGHYFL